MGKKHMLGAGAGQSTQTSEVTPPTPPNPNHLTGNGGACDEPDSSDLHQGHPCSAPEIVPSGGTNLDSDVKSPNFFNAGK